MMNHSGKSTLSFVFLLIVGPLGAQPQFVKAPGGDSTEYAWSLAQTADSGYVITGQTESFGAGLTDVFLIKVDRWGNHEWTRTLGGPDYDYGYSVIQTAGGGYAITGQTHSFGADSGDVFLAKFDNSGNHQWTRTLGGVRPDWGISVIQTTDGGYALTGYTDSYGVGRDLLLAKFDGSGNHQWTRTLGGADYDYGWSLVQTQDGGYAVAGHACSFGAGYRAFLLAKFDGSGNHQWTRALGGWNEEFGQGLIQTRDGGYAIVGTTLSFGAGSYDVLLAKFDSSGTHEWTRTLGGSSLDDSYSLLQNAEGEYVLGGITGSFGAGSWDAFLAKFDSSGNHQVTRTVGGEQRDQGFAVVQTVRGGYAIVGQTYSFGADSGDILLAVFDSSGNTCIAESCTPTVQTVSPTVDTVDPSVSSCFPSISEPSPTITSPVLTTVTVCPQHRLYFEPETLKVSPGDPFEWHLMMRNDVGLCGYQFAVDAPVTGETIFDPDTLTFSWSGTGAEIGGLLEWTIGPDFDAGENWFNAATFTLDCSPKLAPGDYIAIRIYGNISPTADPGVYSCSERGTYNSYYDAVDWIPVPLDTGWIEVLGPVYPCGDCNGDGKVTFADALALKNWYYQTPPGCPACQGQGDVNLDGNVTFGDALYIKNYYYQTPPGSPPPCEPTVTAPFRERRMMR